MTDDNAPLRLDTAADAVPALPGIAAAFLVKFDHRKGYSHPLGSVSLLTLAQLCYCMAQSCRGRYVCGNLRPVAHATNPSPVQVEGAVEFKSLPSGLHNVQQDLV